MPVNRDTSRCVNPSFSLAPAREILGNCSSAYEKHARHGTETRFFLICSGKRLMGFCALVAIVTIQFIFKCQSRVSDQAGSKW